MDFILNISLRTFEQVLLAFLHNWPFLLGSILIASSMKLFLDARRVSAFLKRHRNAGIFAATTAAVATPLCSCGTIAVLLGMLTSLMPWAPIIAFMVASPLTSPAELVYSAGLFDWPFALTFYGASIVLGLAGGVVGAFLESRGWLKNQSRMPASDPGIVPLPSLQPATCCSTIPTLVFQPTSCCPDAVATAALSSLCRSGGPKPVKTSCCSAATAPAHPRVQFRDFVKETWKNVKQLLVMFFGFAFIGYFLNNLIPQEWIAAAFGAGHSYSVPLAATLALPFYINTEASLPLIRALLDAGMSQGAAMAFLIAGSGTSIGAIAGALTIARWRVITVVVGVLWVGAMAFGYLYNFLFSLGLY